MWKTVLSCIITLILLAGFAFLIYYPILALNPLGDSGYRETVPSTEITIHNEEEYYAFLQNHENLPENFVTAEMLECFGSFNTFYCPDEATIGGYDGYSYTLKQKDFPKVFIYIHHKPQNRSLTPIDKSAVTTHNMTKIAEKGGRVIRCDEGIEYQYLHGSLDAIVWTIGDVQIKLRTSVGVVIYYDFPKDHILGKALSKDPEDQLAVYNQLKSMINGTNE